MRADRRRGRSLADLGPRELQRIDDQAAALLKRLEEAKEVASYLPDEWQMKFDAATNERAAVAKEKNRRMIHHGSLRRITGMN